MLVAVLVRAADVRDHGQAGEGYRRHSALSELGGIGSRSSQPLAVPSSAWPWAPALLVKLWCFFECFPLLLVMAENHQPDVLPVDQIQQFQRTGTDRGGVRVARVVLLVPGKARGEGYRINRQ